MNITTYARTITTRPTAETTWQAWRELSDRLIVDMAIDAASARIATTYARREA